MKKTLNIGMDTGTKKIVSVFIFLISFISASAQELTLTDCDTGKPISDVIVTRSDESRFLAITNHNGIIKWQKLDKPKVFHFKKLGSLDTSVTLSQNQTSLCLIQKLTQLQIVEIEGKYVPLHQQFEMFIEKNKPLLSDKTDSLYYDFNYKMVAPETGEKCEMSGVLMIPLRSPAKQKYRGGMHLHFVLFK